MALITYNRYSSLYRASLLQPSGPVNLLNQAAGKYFPKNGPHCVSELSHPYGIDPRICSGGKEYDEQAPIPVSPVHHLLTKILRSENQNGKHKVWSEQQHKNTDDNGDGQGCFMILCFLFRLLVCGCRVLAGASGYSSSVALRCLEDVQVAVEDYDKRNTYSNNLQRECYHQYLVI